MAFGGMTELDELPADALSGNLASSTLVEGSGSTSVGSTQTVFSGSTEYTVLLGYAWHGAPNTGAATVEIQDASGSWFALPGPGGSLTGLHNVYGVRFNNTSVGAAYDYTYKIYYR